MESKQTVVNPKAIFKSRLPSLARVYFLNTVFKSGITLSSMMLFLLMCASIVTLCMGATLSMREFGVSFIWNSVWDPVTGNFGAWPFIIGTLLTSVLALLISTPFSLAIAIFLNEYVRHQKIRMMIRSAIELLAGIPSVIYGFWGLTVLVPLIRTIEFAIGVPPYGVGILTASIILAIMIIPYSTLVSYEIMRLMPHSLKEASYAMGATKLETIIKIIIPWSFSGIMSGILLALGRALGETMAVTMVIGNTNAIPTSIFSSANTIASVIANEFAEATEDLYLSSLVQLGFILFIITIGFSALGQRIVKKWSFKK